LDLVPLLRGELLCTHPSPAVDVTKEKRRKEKRRKGKGREGKGREGKGREGKGRECLLASI